VGISDIYDVRRSKANKTKKFIDRKEKHELKVVSCRFDCCTNTHLVAIVGLKLGYNRKGELSGLDVELGELPK
jgi:hypothetical protein